MKLKFLLAIVFSALFFTVASAQKKLSKKKLEKLATSYYEVGEFHHALQYYKQLDSLQPNQAETNYLLGTCVFNSEQKSKSLSYFEKAKSLGYKKPDLDLYLARALHLNHRFEEAITAYKSYTPAPPKKGEEEEVDPELLSRAERELMEIKEDVGRYITMCETGIQLVRDSLDVLIENMGPIINSPYPDYVPVVSADETELIFTSRRPNTTGGKIDPVDDHYFEDVYICTRENPSDDWSAPKDMGPHVNTPKHDACVGLSPDGQKLFIYRADYKKKHIAGNIYVSNLEGEKWSSPVKMENHINSTHWEPSATISADEKTVFFSSNRPGGYGGTDIYMVKLQENGKWGEPINLGPSVNTKYDEDAPYIHPDNKTLFFSSRGHKTMGGFDIFTTTFNDTTKQWNAPENVGYPINTADDDIYFIWSADGSKGYFSSWRDDSYGEKDLYVIHRSPTKANLIVLKGNIYDVETTTPLGSTITIKNNETGELVGVYNSNFSTGKYSLVIPPGKNYSIIVKADGYESDSSNINIEPNSSYFSVKKDFYLKPLKKEDTTVQQSAVVLNNVFFDFDRATLRKESTPELDKIKSFLEKYPELKVEISGHTDSYGSDQYNQKLSENRAKAVVSYLINKRIAKERLVAKGYGESKPIATNETDEGRQLNRRTEMKLIDNERKVVNAYDNTKINYINEFKGDIAPSGRTKAKK